MVVMKNMHTITTTDDPSTGIVSRFIDTLKRGMASDIVSYPATRGVGIVSLPDRTSGRTAVSDIVGGVSDRETLAAA